MKNDKLMSGFTTDEFSRTVPDQLFVSSKCNAKLEKSLTPSTLGIKRRITHIFYPHNNNYEGEE